jgi:hypothetical protein
MKDWYLTSLLFCFLGVFGLFTYYGYLQEEL